MSETEILMAAPEGEIRDAYAALQKDMGRLEGIKEYVMGNHRPPYMPKSANAEYKLLAARSVTNWMPMVVDATAQALFVDNFRLSSDKQSFDTAKDTEIGATSPSWLHWQGSRMDAKQATLFRAALEYGHSFTITERDPKRKKIRTRGVSPLRAIAMFEDPLADLEPTSGLEVVRRPTGSGKSEVPGKGRYYDEVYRWSFTFKRGMKNIVVQEVVEHEANRCPMTRLATHVDLDGNTTGLIEPLFALQDRVNQTVFDLLVAQTYTSFEVRTVSGMAPPLKMTRDEDGNATPVLDDNGQPVADEIQVNGQRWLYAKDKDTKFGHLPAGELAGLIAAVELAMRQLSAVAQVPAHYMLGQIANVNADGLRAAAESLSKKNMEIASSFGESIERIFRLFAEISGETVSEDEFGEVVWRDLTNASIAQTADALGKFADQLDIPKRGLWSRVPGVTRTELNTWNDMLAEDRKARSDLMANIPDEVLALIGDDAVYEATGTNADAVE